MQDFFKTPADSLSMSLRAFREEILTRGWKKATLNRGASNFLTVTGLDGKVQVVNICNVGCGGTIENMTETLPDDTKHLSETIARSFDLPVIEIDFLDEYVIEVNSSPSLHYPAPDASSTLCVKKFVDYLETL